MSLMDKLNNASKKAKGLARKPRSKGGSKKGSDDESDKVKKKVKRKTKTDPELDELIDFSDIEGMMSGDELPADPMGQVESEAGGQEARLTDLEDKIVQLDGSVKSTRSSLSGVNDRLEEIDQNILKLLSVYEVVKRDINPFIEKKGVEEEEEETIDPAFLDIEGAELIKTPGIDDELDDNGFGKDILLSNDKDEGSMGEPEEDNGISLFDIPDLGPEKAPEKEIVDEPPPSPPAPDPMTGLRNGGFKMEQHRQPPQSFTPPPHLLDDTRTVSHNGHYILETISHDYRTVILALRWIEFMFERVTRDRISALLDYYKDIGWISPKVKSHVMAYARGEVQNIFKYEPPETEDILEEPKSPADYKKVSDWRLSADDHLKSLLFITKIAGIEVNKDTFNSLEEDIKIFTRNLEGYHGV